MKKLEATTFEIFIWVAIIFASIGNAVFKSEDYSKIFLFIVILACAILYVKSRRLFVESFNKTKELVKKQKELTSRQKTIDLIFENSEDGLLVLNEDQKIVSFSPGMEKMTGFKSENVVGLSAKEILKFKGDQNNSLLPDMMFMSIGKNKGRYIRNIISTKEGREIQIEASHTLIYNVKEHTHTALAILRDVTYEEELIKRDKEFIAITSHQMNTPLSIIRGYVSLIMNEKAGQITAKQKVYLKEIYDSVLKIISITNNLLSISRIEQDKIKLQKDDASLIDLLSKIKSSYEKIAEEKKVGLEIEIPENDIIIFADPDKLYQAISNLVDNALKYTPKGKVGLTVSKNGQNIVITISDTGIGISKEEIDHIGQKFYRSQNAIDIDNKGTGLGLFIAKTIVEKHDGKLNIESEVGKGTKMIIELPK